MEYDSFYFLHIPKCDGRRFIDKFVTPLKEANPNLVVFDNEKDIKDYSVIVGYPPVISNAVIEKTPIKHQGWDSRITSRTYVVCLMRDPVERAVSYYVYLITKAVERLPGYDKNTSIHFLKDQFIRCVELNSRFHNPVSKSLLFDLEKDRRRTTDDEILNHGYNKDFIMHRAKRINLLMDIKTFKDVDKQALANKISEDLGCTPFTPNNFGVSKGYTIPGSKKLYNLLTEKDKQYLRKYLELDYEIYDNKSLFWIP